MNIQVILNAVPEMVAQLLGFLIVFFILKKYAFGAILGVIDARRKTIEDTFSEIEKTKKDLEDLEKEYRRKLDGIEQEARQKIQEAALSGAALARDIQEKGRQESQKILDRAQAEIKQDLAKARAQMRNEIVEISTLITENVLKEKLSAQDHKKLVDDFIKELEKV